MSVTKPTKKERDAARADWLAKRSGLTVAQVVLIEHYDSQTVSDYDLVRSLPADWFERWQRVLDAYLEMLSLRLALRQALDLIEKFRQAPSLANGAARSN